MRTFDQLGKKKIVIGMVHLLPLPGTPFYQAGNVEQTLEKAVADATALYHGGADGCLVQTVDRVYPAADEADYARVAAMAAVTKAVADATGPEFHIGVQIMVDANPHDFLTYRASIGAQSIKLIAEVNSRHFRWLGDQSTADIARMAARV